MHVILSVPFDHSDVLQIYLSHLQHLISEQGELLALVVVWGHAATWAPSLAATGQDWEVKQPQ